jgi:alkylation response protein AidB-like acyl-CoA dehydrogenase
MIEAVRSLAPGIHDRAERIERERRLPSDLVADLREAGVFRLCVPRALGGVEADPATLLAVLEELAYADGSTGWCAMIGATCGLMSAYLPGAEARAIYGASPDVVTAGVFAPAGRAVRENAHYRVTGRWRFASGCQHADWLMGGCVVRDGDAPQARMVFFPASDAEVIDTWTVSGLCGTGSHDIAVRDLAVPVTRSVAPSHEPPVAEGALYAFPLFGLLALGIAAVGLGIARRARDDFITLAGGKTPAGGRRTLAERSAVQAQLAEAEATRASAQAFLREVVDAAWAEARAGGRIDVPARTRLRLAATHAATAAARAVDVVYTAAGGTAIYTDSPLQRAFRDVHVVTQHMMVAQPTWELTGRLLLGLETDTSLL